MQFGTKKFIKIILVNDSIKKLSQNEQNNLVRHYVGYKMQRKRISKVCYIGTNITRLQQIREMYLPSRQNLI